MSDPLMDALDDKAEILRFIYPDYVDVVGLQEYGEVTTNFKTVDKEYICETTFVSTDGSLRMYKEVGYKNKSDYTATKNKYKIPSLKIRMEIAVEKEDYLKAAKLRDILKKLEK